MYRFHWKPRQPTLISFSIRGFAVAISAWGALGMGCDNGGTTSGPGPGDMESDVPGDLDEVAADLPSNGDDPADQPGDDPADQPGDDPADQPGDDPADQPGDDPTDQPGDDPADQPGDDPTDQPGDDPTDQPGDDPTDQPGDDPTDQPGDDPADEDIAENPEIDEIIEDWPPTLMELYNNGLRQCRLPNCAPGEASGLPYGGLWKRHIETTASTCAAAIGNLEPRARVGHTEELVGTLEDLLGRPTGECLADANSTSVGVAKRAIAALCSRGEETQLGTTVVFYQVSTVAFTDGEPPTRGEGRGKVYLDFPPTVEILGITDCDIDTRIIYSRP